MPEIFEIKELRAKKALVSLIDVNLVRILIDEESEIDKDDILEINSKKFELVNDNLHSVIFIAPKYGSISSEARETSASMEVNHNAIAKAVVVPSLGQRLVANFFIKFNKPPTTIKIFSNEEDARKWLEEKIKE